MLNGQDIGWLQEALDGVDGFVEEVPEVPRLKPLGPGRVLDIPPRELQTEENSYLPEHDYYTADDGQPVVEDDIDQVTATAAFYMEDEMENPLRLTPKDAKFEFHFRAFLHNMDYSYNPSTISETLRRLQEIK